MRPRHPWRPVFSARCRGCRPTAWRLDPGAADHPRRHGDEWSAMRVGAIRATTYEAMMLVETTRV
jgi:hypothetical protein